MATATAAAVTATTTATATTAVTATTTAATTTAKRQSGRKQDCHYNRHRQSKLRRHRSPPFAKEHDTARSSILPAFRRRRRRFRQNPPECRRAADRW